MKTLLRASSIISAIGLLCLMTGVGRAAETSGCLIERVQSGSPAESAGLRVADIIVEASSAPVRTEGDLQSVVQTAGDQLPLTVQRGAARESIVARLNSKATHGYRLGVLCAPDTAMQAIQSSSQNPSVIYIGPAFSWISINNDFDGNHILINQSANEISAVPDVDSAFGYGGVLGLQSSLRQGLVDVALELSYQQAKMDNSLAGAGNSEKATLHEVGISAKGYFQREKAVHPVVGFGLDFPWLTIPDGTINQSLTSSDSTFSGLGLHVGGGIAFDLMPQLSLEAFVAYHWRRFNELGGNEIDDALVSHSFEPTVSLRYRFSIGSGAKEKALLPPKV